MLLMSKKGGRVNKVQPRAWWCGIMALLLLAVLAGTAGASERSILIDDFENGLGARWEEKGFKGRTLYQVTHDDDGSHVLKAESRDAASGLIFEKEYSLRDYPFLAWRWKVANILDKGDETKKAGDDYASRIYVIFHHWFLPKTKTINYIWANKLPQGEHVPNPFTGNAIMVAVESGRENVGHWISERRNVLEDYRQLFGEEPPMAGAIAIMTDTDNTGGAATAWYDDIRIER